MIFINLNPIIISILEAIDQRIVRERYTDASVMLQYLHNPSARLESRSKVKTFCANLLFRIMDLEDTDIPTSEDVIIDSNVFGVSYDLEPGALFSDLLKLKLNLNLN